MIGYDPRDIVRAEMQSAAREAASTGQLPFKPGKLNADAKRILSEADVDPISPVIVSGCMRMLEWAVIALTGAVIYSIYLGDAFGFSWRYAIPIAVITSLVVLAFQFSNLYRIIAMRSLRYQLPRIIGVWTTVFTIVTAAAFFLKVGEDYSRVWFGAWFVGGLAMITVLRISVMNVLMRWSREGRLERRAVIIGGGKPAEELISAIQASQDNDVRIYGVFDDRNDDRSAESYAGCPMLGNVSDLVEFARHTRIDVMIVSLPISAESRVLQMLRKLWVLPVDIRLSAHTNRLRFHPRSYSYIGNVPMLDVYDKPIADWDVVAKWVFDKIIGTAALIGLLPLMLLTAIAIKLDSKGPVLFRQKRHGFNNEMIEVFKFRSMRTDMCDAKASKLVTKDDPRVTRVGKFIRKTSIDELPQLINVVFKGNLSLVGPRPHAEQAKADGGLYKDVVDGYFARHRVKPGITGWAQVNGWRGETDTKEKIQRRVEHDLYYIENWSLMFDLYILGITPMSLVTKTDGAY